MSKPVSDADIADLLAEMSSSYEGEAVERKNRAIRNGAAALRQLMAQRDDARDHVDRMGFRTLRLASDVEAAQSRIRELEAAVLAEREAHKPAYEALGKANRMLQEFVAFHDNHAEKPCGDWGAECPIQMAEWFEKEDRDALAEISAVLRSRPTPEKEG